MCEKPRESFSLGLIKCLMGYPICRDEEVGFQLGKTWGNTGDEVVVFSLEMRVFCFFLGGREIFEGDFFLHENYVKKPSSLEC